MMKAKKYLNKMALLLLLSVPMDLAIADDWSESYQDALTMVGKDSAMACGEFHRLSVDSSSNIKELGLARFLQHCSSDETSALSGLRALYENESLDWLKPLLDELIVELAEKTGSDKTLADFAVSYSRNLRSQPEKESFLKAALGSARKSAPEQVESIEAELYMISPRLRPQPTPDQWLRVADDFRINSQADRAVEYYEKVVSHSDDSMEIFRALNGMRELHKSLFRFSGAPKKNFLDASLRVVQFNEKVLNEVSDFKNQSILIEAIFQYSRDEWSYGSLDTALADMQRLASNTDLKPEFRAYGLWLQSRVFATQGNWSESARVSDKAVELLTKEVDQSNRWTSWHWQVWDDAFWANALSLRKTGEIQKSVEALRVAYSHTPNETSQIKFLFWLAQNYKDQNNNQRMRANLEAIIKLDPYGYYGFLSHRDLNQPLTPLPDLNFESPERPNYLSVRDFEVLKQLTSVHEVLLAKSFSRKVLRERSIELKDLKLRAYVHDFEMIWRIYFRDIPRDQRDGFMAKYARLFYPQPFREIVDHAIALHPTVKPEYVYAIMRQESGFNPTARSWADAYGLLQILPRVARELHEQTGISFQQDHELYQPEINIPLGVTHLKNFSESVDGGFILRTASYNAGPSVAKKWKQRIYNGNVYEFLEEIPFQETRSYVRLVMRNYIMNLRLSASEPFEFPSDLLRL